MTKPLHNPFFVPHPTAITEGAVVYRRKRGLGFVKCLLWEICANVALASGFFSAQY